MTLNKTTEKALNHENDGFLEQDAQKKRDSERSNEMRCGIGPFKFLFFQNCARMGCFVGVYSLCGLTTQVLSMYIISQITTIEKQYGLSSQQSGLLLSCNDIGFLATTMFASYISRKVHIPRSLWLTTILYGVAGLICSLAYFISKDFISEQSQVLIKSSAQEFRDENSTSFTVSSRTPICKILGVNGYTNTGPASNITECNLEVSGNDFGIGEPNRYTKVGMTILAIGMIIQGVGKAPRFPFITTYVDDNGKKKNTAMYMGIISGVGIFGPAIAFTVGGFFSTQYVTLEKVPIGPRHPAWIGAWWLGFLVFGGLAILVSFPLLCFPKRMTVKQPLTKTKKLHVGSIKVERVVQDFMKTILRLVTNPVYMPMVVATCIILFSVAGAVSFSAKYLETQYFIPAWKANMLLGVTNIVAASAGTITGGFVVTKKKLSPLQCLKMLIGVGCFSLIQNAMGFILGCPNADIAGYNTNIDMPGKNYTCSSLCECDSRSYFPVCGSDGQSYMSPCYAGCQHQKSMSFEGCMCIGENGTAVAGLCETSCGTLYPYLISNIFGAFLGTLAMMPGLIVTIRSVSDGDKAMAVGFSSLLNTLCGWLAGPVVFGMIVDTTCTIWSASCSGNGACALYDNDDLRIKKHTAEFVPKIFVIAIYVLVFLKARKKNDWTSDPVQNDADMSMIKDQDTEL